MTGNGRVRKLTITLLRPNEYTTWRPRIDRGVGWTGVNIGVLTVAWERHPGRSSGGADVDA